VTAESSSASRSAAAQTPASAAAQTPASAAALADATPRALLLDFGSVISVSAFEKHRQTERLLNLKS